MMAVAASMATRLAMPKRGTRGWVEMARSFVVAAMAGLPPSAGPAWLAAMK